MAGMPWEDDAAPSQGMPWEEPHAPAEPTHDSKPQSWGSYFNSIAKNFGAGLEEAVPELANFATTTVDRAMGIPVDLPAYQKIKAGAAASASDKIGKVTGLEPSKVPATGFGDKFVRNVGKAAPFIAATGGGGAAQTMRSIVTGLGAVGGQTVAQEAAPDSPLAQAAGALIGGLVTGKATQIPSMIRRASTGVTPQQGGSAYVQDLMESAGKTPADLRKFGDETGDKPFIGAEAIGRPGITATRSLGLRQGQTGDALEALLGERAEGTGGRVMSDFQEASGISPEAALGDIEGVVKTGQQRVKPLYEKAEEGHSIAPFEKAFEQENVVHGRAVNDAQQAVNDANNKMTLAQKKLQAAGDNVYGQNSAREDVRAAQKGIDAAEQKLTQAQGVKDATASRLKQAQDDRAAGVKGGIWSPYLQRLLDNPVMRRGMARGYELEQLDADAKNVPFNPRDHAITGVDADGTPIVSGVPNMKVLDMAKKGLDAEINSYADKNTGRLNMRDPKVQKLLDFKKSFLNEIDNLNPDYKAARAEASDYLGAESAFNRAGKMFANPQVSNKQMQDFLGGLGSTDREAAKGGVANYLFKLAENGKLTGKTFTKPVLQKKLAGVVNDPEKTASLLIKMNQERNMAKSGQRMSPGLNSTTFESTEAASAQDKAGAALKGAGALYSLFSGHPFVAAGKAFAAAEKLGAFAKNPGMTIPIRDEAGKLLMMHPHELASHLENYGATKLAQHLAKPRISKRGFLPALPSAMSAGSQFSLPTFGGDEQ